MWAPLLFSRKLNTSPFAERETGNVLFLVLLGVVLFAALSYAIMASNRSSGDAKLSDDQARLVAASLIQYAGQIENAVTRVMVTNKCSASELNFANPIWYSTGNVVYQLESDYPNSPPSKKCHIFHPEGGGAVATIFNKMKVSPQTYGGMRTGHGAIIYAAVPNIGTSAPDLILAYPHIKRSVCEQVHKKLNLAGTNWNFWPYGDCTWTAWKGAAATEFTTTPSCPVSVTNLTTWCTKDVQNTGAYFYHVILAR